MNRMQPITAVTTKGVLLVAVLGMFALSMLAATPAYAEEQTAKPLTTEELNFFESKIRPVLVKECYGCHSNKAGNVRGGLRLDTKALMHLGGGTGPAIVPGDLEESWLYNAITHQDFVMPPKRKLPQNVIDDFGKWIEMGAPDPRTTDTPEFNPSITDDDIREARETFWAYQSPEPHAAPSVGDTQWARTEIDQFLLAKLESAGLRPTADAQPGVVLRRLTFDLVGLPPTPERIAQFTQAWQRDTDEAPDQAIAAEVDRLLATKQFGERWGRHWLDVVRYAESTGREVNTTYPHAWRYRDYVIDAFNADKPYDEFVQEQLAGDLLPVDSDERWAANLIATTFLAIGPKNLNQNNRVQFAADLVDEQIDATTRVFLGMSVACARCHDHKFDAIPQTDYYALAGVFRNTETFFGKPTSGIGNIRIPQEKQSSSLLILPVEDPNSFDKRYTAAELEKLEEEMNAKMRDLITLRRENNRSKNNRNSNDSAAKRRAVIRGSIELSDLSTRLAAVDDSGNPRSYCMGVQDADSFTQTKLLVRGEIDQPAQAVPRGFPQVLGESPGKFANGSSGRLELARWIGSERNPLTARVMANRIWQHMIGRGIVASMENFGTSGQAPSHPELLDHLAASFVESGWSVKSLVRQIAMSRAYRMDSTFNQKSHDHDPDNALVWRANAKRLTAEAIRDAMLSASGELDHDRPRASEVAKAGYMRIRNGSLGIRSVVVSMGRADLADRFSGNNMQSSMRRNALRGMSRADRLMLRDAAENMNNQLDMADAKFRSVYLTIVRDEEPRGLEVFDFADSSAITGEREASNTPNQALYMMNNPFVLQQSQALAARVARNYSTTQEQIKELFLLTYGRSPTSKESKASAAFLRKFAASTGEKPRSAATLTALSQSLFASAEFRILD